MKLKRFVWKCLHQIISINEVVYRRIVKGDTIRKCCEEEVETAEHMLFFCSNARKMWKLAPVQWDGFLQFRYDFWKWWEELSKAIQRINGKEHIELTVNIMWNIWRARNEIQFYSNLKNGFQRINKALVELREYKEANEHTKSYYKHNQQAAAHAWNGNHQDNAMMFICTMVRRIGRVRDVSPEL